MAAALCGDGRPDDVIDIVYTARPCGAGWVPMLIINGRERWNWTGNPWCAEDAMTLAQVEASEEADRYSGDWKISITRREPDAPRR